MEYYEHIEINGTKVLLSSARLDKKEIENFKDKIFTYGIRHADDTGEWFGGISEYVWVNHFADIISKEKLNLEKINETINNDTLNINFIGESITIIEYLNNK